MFRLYLSLSAVFVFAEVSEAAESFFKDEVAVVFQRRCVSCHNEQNRKGDFSIETRASAFAESFIKPGDAVSSHLVELIDPEDGAPEMPKDADPLSKSEVELIRRWIDQGAKWPNGFMISESTVTDFDWWSYKPIVHPKVPDVKPRSQNPIDAFVSAKRSEKGLSSSPKADRRTLIRRLTYDLIGLPPTPEQVDDFVQSKDPDAYNKLVDRLLESRHYGERWGRHWLDVVKYADTCGYDKDKLRNNAWPYRDYVIQSLNEDKPYWRFVQEQIAGDVLFPGEPDGILGLGFIAAGPWDFIGHVEVPESKMDGMVARNLDRDDMVSNTINTFCSLTVQCARCHHHKFDPITQQDYYGLQSIFAAVDRAERAYDLDPKVEAKRLNADSQLAAKRKELKQIQTQIDKAGGDDLKQLDQEIQSIRPKLKAKKSPEFGFHSQFAKTANATKWVEVDLGEDVQIESIVLRPCHDDFGGIGSGFGFPVRFKVQVALVHGEWTDVGDQTKSDLPNPGLQPVEFAKLEQAARYVRVTATKLFDRSGSFMMSLAELQVFDSNEKNVAVNKKVNSIDSIQAPVRWARKNLVDGKWPAAVDPSFEAELADLEKQRFELLAKIETPKMRERRDELKKQIQALSKELQTLPTGKMVYAAATTFKSRGNFKPTEGKLRPIYVLHRGNIGQRAEPATPSTIPLRRGERHHLKPTQDEAQRRAQLARRLTDKDHPLVWRSIVNRIWQYHFGQGIVATPNDFGRMGAVPTHPELLDWLAIEFRDGRQSWKDMHRLIVTSETYQQSSASNDHHQEIDSSNQFLWRMNRRRLSAEEIRDSILSVSGALDSQMGGPGFYLFALERTTHSPHYEYHKFDPADKKSHRRSIYRFIVRSQPDPWMTTLDCADSSQSTPRRNETLTSLQALSLLNNRFNLYMARQFADRLRREGSEQALAEMVELGFSHAFQRKPTSQERSDLTEYAKEHGVENLCRVLFNLSEFVYVD